MRKKLAAVALLLCAGTTVRSPMPLAAQGSLRYTVELEGLRETAQRLELRAPGWRLLALERGAGLDPDFLAFGLECPWAAAGPLAPRGLLRALSDPLGYSPASGVFSEPAGFRLEGSLQGTSRRGLWLEPWPGRLGLFLVRRPPGQAEDGGAGLSNGGSPGRVQAGGSVTFRWPGPGAVRAEAQVLALLSRPEPDWRSESPISPSSDASSEWFFEQPPFPGGSLLHLGGVLRLDVDGGRLACYLLAAASGGQRVPAGLLGLGRLEAQGGCWNAQGLLGACSRDYHLPQGEPYSGAWAAGARLEVQPRPALRLAGSWQRRVEWPPAAPEGYLPGTREGELSARLAFPLRAGGRLEVRAAAEAGAQYATDGQTEQSAGAGLDLELLGNPGRVELQLRGERKEDGAKLRGQLCGERGAVRVQVGAAGPPGGGQEASGFCWRPFGRLELSGKGFRFWFSAGKGESGREISLGWSAVQALPKSPTVRISRCRR